MEGKSLYQPRCITGDRDWLDRDGIKLYAIRAQGRELDVAPFLSRLEEVKQSLSLDWPALAAFTILHHGDPLDYLVMCWWGNDNELFTHVSVREQHGWVHDPHRYSFCLYDLEVFQAEREAFIAHLYRDQCSEADSEHPGLAGYRQARLLA